MALWEDVWVQVNQRLTTCQADMRCSYWREGQVDILFDRQSASLPAAIGQPTSHVTRYQPVRLWVDQICGGREGQVDILCDRQSASQPACQLQLASQPAMWQDINLSGFGLVRYLVGRRTREPDHIGPQSRIPALPLVPPGEWPTWSRPGKWHKWALQPLIYLWHYL